MALDPYRRCPCGSGKKVKFCCSKDILTDLEKLFRVLEGEQRVAGLDQVSKLIEAKGPRPALLVLKANLQIELNSLDEAEKTIEQLFKAVPHNPAALGLKATMEAHRDQPDSAVEKLQEAIEYSAEEMPSSVYKAIGAVGLRLLLSGHLLGARGQFLLQAAGRWRASGIRLPGCC